MPQTLTLWNDGQTILTAKVNTGVPGAPTPFGTHAVFEHIPVGTMRGLNPDGSHYVDPGIKWISYFYGGEAIHGFDRATYGFPQSVGCVETPIDTAGQDLAVHADRHPGHDRPVARCPSVRDTSSWAMSRGLSPGLDLLAGLLWSCPGTVRRRPGGDRRAERFDPGADRDGQGLASASVLGGRANRCAAARSRA